MNKSNIQHLRLTLAEVLDRYQRGYLSAKGALGFWVECKLAHGWDTRIVPKQIQKFFTKNNKPMPRSTFWGALNALRDDGVIEFNQPDQIYIKRLHAGNNQSSDEAGFSDLSEISDSVHNPDTPSEKINDGSEFRIMVQDSGLSSEKLDEEKPKSPPCNGFKSLPYSSSSSSQFKNNSLSKSSKKYFDFLEALWPEERESWNKFVQEKIAGLPHKPCLLDEWLIALSATGKPRWESLSEEWASAERQKGYAQANVPVGVDDKANAFVKKLNQLTSPTEVSRNICHIFEGMVYGSYTEFPLRLDYLLGLDLSTLKKQLNWRAI